VRQDGGALNNLALLCRDEAYLAMAMLAVRTIPGGGQKHRTAAHDVRAV
jgi:hypothetical protein